MKFYSDSLLPSMSVFCTLGPSLGVHFPLTPGSRGARKTLTPRAVLASDIGVRSGTYFLDEDADASRRDQVQIGRDDQHDLTF